MSRCPRCHPYAKARRRTREPSAQCARARSLSLRRLWPLADPGPEIEHDEMPIVEPAGKLGAHVAIKFPVVIEPPEGRLRESDEAGTSATQATQFLDRCG